MSDFHMVVCVKAVPGSTEVKMDPKTNTIVRDGKQAVSFWRKLSWISTVINPHLNKYWCEEGFLPSIYPSQRIVDEKNNMRAFFYALTLEKPCCVRLKNTKGKI